MKISHLLTGRDQPVSDGLRPINSGLLLNIVDLEYVSQQEFKDCPQVRMFNHFLLYLFPPHGVTVSGLSIRIISSSPKSKYETIILELNQFMVDSFSIKLTQ